MSNERIIPLIIALAMLVPLTLMLVRLVWLAWQSRTWPQVKARIVESEFQQTAGFRRQGSVSLEYHYTVNGQEYRARRVRFGDFLGAQIREAYQTAQQYQKGSQVVIRHHPTKPQLATIESKVTSYVWIWLMIGLLGLISLGYGLLIQG